jgi:hypothetical protein
MNVGRVLPRFVTPSDVRDLKNRVNAFVLAEDAAVDACASIPAGPRAGWKTFVASWQSYFTEDDSWLNAAAQMDEGEAYESDIEKWQAMIAGYKCTPNAPPSTPIDPPVFGGDNSPNANGWQSTARTVAIAGAVIAVAIGMRAVLR